MNATALTTSLVNSLGPFAVVLSGFAVGAIAWRAWPFFRHAIGRGAPEGAEPSDGRARYEVFEGMRGVLCLFVLVHHAEITRRLRVPTGDWMKAAAAAHSPLLPRDITIALFFAMTSFLFYARTLERPRRLDVSQFLARRAWRLGPALVVSMLCIFAVELIPGTPHMTTLADAGIIALKAVSLGSLGTSNLPQNAGALWTLGYEWVFYLAFPLLAAAVVGGVPTWARIAACVAAASFGTGRLDLPDLAMAYPAGVVAAHLHNAPALRRLAGHWGGSVVVVLLCVAATFAANRQNLHVPPRVIVTIAGCIFTLIAAGNDVFGLLRLAAVRAVGIVSYSVYLFHGIALYAFRPIIVAQAKSATPLVAYATMCAIVAGVVALSFVTYRFIEHRGVEFGRRRMEGTKPPAPVAAKGPPVERADCSVVAA